MAEGRRGGKAERREGGRANFNLLACLAVAAGLLAATNAGRILPPFRPPALPPAASAEAVVRDADIAFFKARTQRDSYGAMDRSRLAALYLERARATSSDPEFELAAALADSSLHLRRARNEAALLVLVGARLGQHRFGEALQAARELVAVDPTRPRLHAVLGEVLLELGRYGEADSAFVQVAESGADASTLARLARWHEVRGRIGDARRLLTRARDLANRSYGRTPSSIVWFELRVGEFAARYGLDREAQASVARALGSAPDDYRVLTAAARLALTHHRWVDAADFAGRALAAAPDPTALALLARAERHRSRRSEAESALRAMEGLLTGQTGAWHREWGLALLDEQRRTADVLARAKHELDRRRDVYTLDLYAWALFQSGRRREALPLVDEILAVGIRDPDLLRHALLIRSDAR